MFALVVLAILVVFAIVSLTLRRHGEAARPDPSWRSTDEVFKDPSTGRTMRVWLDRADERHYVPEEPRP